MPLYAINSIKTSTINLSINKASIETKPLYQLQISQLI